jgi:hypothetical protein
VFRFSRSLSEVVDKVLHDVRLARIRRQALPDLIAQVLGAGLIPAAETGCFFNVHNLQRIDICVPDINIVLPSSCVDNKILTFIGKISMTSVLNSLDATGRITAHSTAGNAPQIDCGVWWGNLALWGCLGDDVARYTVRTRPLGAGLAIGTHSNLNGVKSPAACRRIGPSRPGASIPDFSAGRASPELSSSRSDDRATGHVLKATLFSATFPTGSHEMRIDGYSARGALRVKHTRCSSTTRSRLSSSRT